MLRFIAIASAVGVVWTAAATRAFETSSLPVSAVVPGAVMTQPFGCTPLAIEPFDPYCPSRHFHSGIDLAAVEGTPVYAATAGRAVSGLDAKACGVFVSIAYDKHVRVLYCHLHWAAFVSSMVTAGELVGRVGSSGLSTGAHLHLEIDVDGRAVDPVRWLSAS